MKTFNSNTQKKNAFESFRFLKLNMNEMLQIRGGDATTEGEEPPLVKHPN